MTVSCLLQLLPVGNDFISVESFLQLVSDYQTIHVSWDKEHTDCFALSVFEIPRKLHVRK